MSNFNGIQFDAIEEGWSEPATSAVSVRGFPGGNSVAISLGGQREVRRTVSCIFANRDDYVAFALSRNIVLGLTIDNWDTVDVVLQESAPDPPWADGRIKATAKFVLI